MLLGDHLLPGRRIALAKTRQAPRLLVVAVVSAFLVEGEETRKEDDLAGRAKPRPAAAVDQFGGRPLQPGRGHLAGQRALEDQVVEPGRISPRSARRALTTRAAL